MRKRGSAPKPEAAAPGQEGKGATQTSAGVGHPPSVFFGSLASGWILSRIHPVNLSHLLATPSICNAGGAAFLLAAAGFMSSAHRAFKSQGEHPSHKKETRVVVDSGIFAWTRSPYYLGFLCAYPGISLLNNSAWYMAMGVGMFGYLNFVVVPKEEAFMNEHFGESWSSYKKRVRRWGLF